MTRDAHESLATLVAVSSFIGLFCFALWLIPNDLQLPQWVPLVGFGLNVAMIVGGFLWRRRMPVELE